MVIEASANERDSQIVLRRAWIVADAGEVIDSSGSGNRLEGGFVKAASWTLNEDLPVDDGYAGVVHWDGYPVMRFSEVPAIDTRLVHRPDQPPLGGAEVVTGPTPAAIANAVGDAIGARLRQLPRRRARVRAALNALAQ